jgi:hypothetical protein
VIRHCLQNNTQDMRCDEVNEARDFSDVERNEQTEKKTGQRANDESWRQKSNFTHRLWEYLVSHQSFTFVTMHL